MAAETAVAEGETAAEEEETVTQTGPRSVEALLDLMVRFNATGDALPGITVEIVHNDAFQQEKDRHLTWVETRNILRGEERQVPVKLEVDNYEDGDKFSFEWNAFVPPEKRGDYREFAEAGS